MKTKRPNGIQITVAISTLIITYAVVQGFGVLLYLGACAVGVSMAGALIGSKKFYSKKY